MGINFGVVFFHGFVEAEDGFGDFLLKIGEESFNDCQHFGFSFKNSFFQLFLFFPFELLMFLHVQRVVVEFFDSFLEETTQISNGLVHAG